MTSEQRKAKNAERYPASVLVWLNEITDEIYLDFETRICENCKYFGNEVCGNGESELHDCFMNDIDTCPAFVRRYDKRIL